MSSLAAGSVPRYTPARLDNMKYSCSTFMLYLGVDKRYDMPHHNVFFAKDYRGNIENIFNRGLLTAVLENEPITMNKLASAGAGLTPAIPRGMRAMSVKVNDVSVGKVTAIDLEGYQALVTLEVRRDVELPDNAVAELRQTSLLGEKFVECR